MSRPIDRMDDTLALVCWAGALVLVSILVLQLLLVGNDWIVVALGGGWGIFSLLAAARDKFRLRKERQDLDQEYFQLLEEHK